MTVDLDTEDIAFLREHFGQDLTGRGDGWDVTGALMTALEALRKSPKAIELMCKLRDEYNVEANRERVLQVLAGPPLRLACDPRPAGCAEQFSVAQVQNLKLTPGKTCPLCHRGVLRDVS